MLPNVALLRVFDFYLHQAKTEAWCKLVHVCRNWRTVIFGSPRRLGLRLYCGATTPIREKLRVWPPLPIVIIAHYYETWPVTWGVDNIIAALEHNDRIYELSLINIPNWRLKGRAHKVGQRVERKLSRILGALWPQSLYLRTDLVCPTSGLSKVQ